MAKSKKKKKSQPSAQSQSPPREPPQDVTMSAKTERASQPRLDKHQRLLSRFYEPMIFLAALGQTRGRHTSAPQATPEQAVRRRFLRNLAFVCDYEKGGPTSTAIAVEERSDKYVFWYATNKSGVSSKVSTFLKSILAELKRIAMAAAPDAYSNGGELARMCTEFARNRAKEEATLLRKHSQDLVKSFGDAVQESPQALRLATWLRKFQDWTEFDPVSVCSLAYESRHTGELDEIQKFLQGRDQLYAGPNAAGADPRQSPFWGVRHYIGRLAHHIRAPKELVEDANSLGYLLDQFSVEQVGTIQAVSAPEPDDQTTLQGILGRMVVQKHDEQRFQELTAATNTLDHKFQIMKRINTWYNEKSFKPRVHCEVRILEHFYEKKLKYIRNDRYIACSKPACFCCQLYIRYHPADCVEPESHQKIYHKWGPPRLDKGSDDPGYTRQRDILNSMVREIRKQAIEQIVQMAGPHPWHADSLTGITSSAQQQPDALGVDSDAEFLDSTDDENSVSSDTAVYGGENVKGGGNSAENIDPESWEIVEDLKDLGFK